MREEILAFMRETAYKPMTAEDLVSAMKIEDVKGFLSVLREMEARGDIIRTRYDRYGLPEKMNLVVGKIQGNRQGFAFLIPDKPDLEDVYLSPNNLNGAMHNDRVVVRLGGKAFGGYKQEGEVIRILERANTRIIGTYEKSKKFGFVIPDESRNPYDIFIPKGEELGANSGDKVVAEITRWPEKRRSPEGKIIEIIGRPGDRGIDIEVIIRKYNLSVAFPQDVLKEVRKISKVVTEEDIKGRLDLRNLTMVTIDGEDAKDLDDAVSLEMLDNGNYRLGVHIADVGHYVKEGSALDKEAYKRGTSIYPVDRVIPMLPPELSNGICSLNPRVDRLALSVFMEIDREGKVLNHSIDESVININERMTYTKVKKILVDKDPELMERYDYLVETFHLMEELCLILRRKRLGRGSIDFEFPEVKVKLNENGTPKEIVPVERTIADRIIEEFMLVCNETVAEDFYWRDVPFLYRVHENPDDSKIDALRQLLFSLGYSLPARSEIHPRDLQKVIEQVKGKEEERVVNTITLRSLKQARYSPESLGHFGLAAKYYCHFTSPIRRYPDLVIHRIIKEILHNGILTDKRIAKLNRILPDIARQSSEMERLAMEAELETLELKKVEYMQDKIGQIFPGVISGVTSFGLFVELENLVEGLVHITTMADDFYEFIEDKYLLLGRHTKKSYRIGDRVSVRVVRANIDERQLDFELA